MVLQIMERLQSSSEKKVKRQNMHLPPTLLSSLRSLLVVISTALIGFAAFRNTLTWHLQRFWGASGNFWQALWDSFLDDAGEDFTVLWVYCKLQAIMIFPNCQKLILVRFPDTNLMMFFTYWTFGGIYTILDVTNKPAALRRYKIQPGTNEPVDKGRLIQVWGGLNSKTVNIFFCKLIH